jgi:aryl-alcohol dehydrogenase-like predicted oxidoreductase
VSSNSTTIHLGETELARIGLGTNQLANTPANVSFVQEAVAAGIGMIDTAYTYVGGGSEATIGAALGGSDRDGIVIATKGGWGAGNGRREILRAQIEESLRRLRTDTIDLYYLHRIDPETPLEESLGTIAEYRERGFIRHVGISEVSVEQIEQARQVVQIAAVQNHYNLAERKHEAVVDHCEANGIVFVPFFPLRDDGGLPVVEIARRHGVTASQVILAWLLRRSPATLPIPGTRDLGHLRENLEALRVELGADELR